MGDVYIQEPFSTDVRERPRPACDTSDVDASWRKGVLSVHIAPLEATRGRGSYRCALKGWEQVYITLTVQMNLMSPFLGSEKNSSLAPMLRFRRRFRSVCNVFKGIKTKGVTDAGVTALRHRWAAVTRMGPTGPITSSEPSTDWIPPNLHGFCKWVVDACDILKRFVLDVVHRRADHQTSGLVQLD